MKKLFKSHPKQPSTAPSGAHDDQTQAAVADGHPRSISPFMVVPSAVTTVPPSPDATYDAHPDHPSHHYLHQQQPVPRERREHRERRDPSHRNSKIGYYSPSEDAWEIVPSSDYQQQPQDVERKASLPGFSAFPNPHPPALSTSRSSSLNSLPPGASPPVPAPYATPSGLANPFGASPTSPVAPQLTSANSNSTHYSALRKKNSPPYPLTKDATRGGAGTTAILRALDPSMLGLGPHPLPQQQQQQQQQHKLQPSQAPAVTIAQLRGSDRLRVETARQQRSNRSLSLSDIEFEAVESDRDSLEEEREREWRERDLEISGTAGTKKSGRDRDRDISTLEKDKDKFNMLRKVWLDDSVPHTSKDTSKDRDRESKGLLDRLQIQPEGDGKRRRDGSHERRERNVLKEREKETKDTKDDRKLQWGALFSSAKDRERVKGRLNDFESNDAHADPLARMVGLFVTPSFEDIDWALALDICERTAWSETDAKSIAKSIRKELKYARPVEQLGAIMLWAIMLQNASDVFITQTSSRKFLDVVEDNITSPKTAMAVRERLLEVLGAAVHLSAERGGKDASKRENFRSLWRKVKPDGYPNEGMPLTTDNPMFRSKSGALHPDKYMNAVVDADNGRIRPPISDRRPSRSGIIPIDEDMRRLFQECKIGRGNAALLSEALAFASPDDLKEKDIIKEFYAKCRASKELVHAQISWASAGAEQSRLRQLEAADLRMNNTNELLSTREEKLLAELLKSNEELTEALKIYDDIERIGVEKEVERHATERSRSEFRAAALDSQGVGEASSFLHAASAAPSSSRSPSPASLLMASQASWVSSHSPYDVQNMEQVSPALTQPLPQPIAMSVSNSSHGHLAPGSLPAPVRTPHGPRSLATVAGARSRSPSPAQASRPNSRDLSQNNSVDMAHGIGRVPLDHTSARNSRTFPIENGVALSEVDDPEPVTVRMSDKAAGKRKVREPDSEHQDGIREVSRSDELLHVELHDPPPPVFEADEGNTNESLPSVHWKPEVHFVYDAAAERTRERIREGMTYSV